MFDKEAEVKTIFLCKFCGMIVGLIKKGNDWTFDPVSLARVESYVMKTKVRYLKCGMS